MSISPMLKEVCYIMSEEISVQLYAQFEQDFREDFREDFIYQYFTCEKVSNFLIQKNGTFQIGNTLVWDYDVTLTHMIDSHLARLIWYVMNTADRFSIHTDNPDDALWNNHYELHNRYNNEARRFREWAFKNSLIPLETPSDIFPSRMKDILKGVDLDNSARLMELAFEYNISVHAIERELMVIADEVVKESFHAPSREFTEEDYEELKEYLDSLEVVQQGIPSSIDVEVLKGRLLYFAQVHDLGYEDVVEKSRECLKNRGLYF